MRDRLAHALLAAVALGLVALLLDPLGDGAPPGVAAQAPADLSGRLLLPRNRDIWQLDAGSRAERRLLAGAPFTFVTQASWAPDGRHVAYSVFRAWQPERPAGSDLYTVSVDGGEPRLVLAALGEEVSFTEPVWTPDGAHLIYSALVRDPTDRTGAVRNRVERVPVAAGERALLVDDGFSPALSRDGRHLAFLRGGDSPAGGDVALWVADATGRDARPVLPPGQFTSLAFPRFAPSGDRLAFAAIGGPARPRGAGDVLPRLARLARAHGLPWDLWEVRTDGTGLRRLTDLAEDDPSVAWSPDGRWVAFQGGSGVHVVDVATTALYLLSETVGFGGMDWAP